MTIDELNAKYGKPPTVVNNTTNNNPFGWTTTPEASKPDNIITSLLHGKSKTPEQPKNALSQVVRFGQNIIGDAISGAENLAKTSRAASGALGESLSKKVQGKPTTSIYQKIS